MRKPVVIVGDAKSTEPQTHGKRVGAIPVELQYVGVGPLHQRWFGDDAIVTQLAKGLGPCMTSDRAVVRMYYDEEAKLGRIRLIAQSQDFRCKPTHQGGEVDVRALKPVATTLARYRDAVAGQFDLRVSSFRVELEVLGGTNVCRLTLGGQYPPDGSAWGACALLGSDEVCVGPRDLGVAGFRFDSNHHAAYLSRCFGI